MNKPYKGGSTYTVVIAPNLGAAYPSSETLPLFITASASHLRKMILVHRITAEKHVGTTQNYCLINVQMPFLEIVKSTTVQGCDHVYTSAFENKLLRQWNFMLQNGQKALSLSTTVPLFNFHFYNSLCRRTTSSPGHSLENLYSLLSSPFGVSRISFVSF